MRPHAPACARLRPQRAARAPRQKRHLVRHHVAADDLAGLLRAGKGGCGGAAGVRAGARALGGPPSGCTALQGQRGRAVAGASRGVRRRTSALLLCLLPHELLHQVLQLLLCALGLARRRRRGRGVAAGRAPVGGAGVGGRGGRRGPRGRPGGQQGVPPGQQRRMQCREPRRCRCVQRGAPTCCCRAAAGGAQPPARRAARCARRRCCTRRRRGRAAGRSPGPGARAASCATAGWAGGGLFGSGRVPSRSWMAPGPWVRGLQGVSFEWNVAIGAGTPAKARGAGQPAPINTAPACAPSHRRMAAPLARGG
jgi:hypothetical protein